MAAWWAAVVVAVSGCSGADDDGAALEGPDGIPIHDEFTGSIEGHVVDDQFEPVANATVRIAKLDLVANANEIGEFLFTFVPEGAHILAADKAGYATASLTVQSFAGSSNTVNLVLQRLAEIKAYHQTLILKGHMACGANIAGSGVLLGSCGDANHKVNFNVSIPVDWTFIVSELQWPASGLSTNPQLQFALAWLETVPGGAQIIHTYGGTEGASPLRISLEPDKMHPGKGAFPAKTPPQGQPAPMEARVSKAAFFAAGQAVGGLHLQQPLQLYHTTFFFAPPGDPAGFTAVPDQ